jgi:carboxylesterase type B
MQDKGYSTELPPIEISEDCLYLNVYRKQPGATPASDTATNGQAVRQVDGVSQQTDGTSKSHRQVGSLANTTVMKPLLPVILFIHGGCFSNGCGSFFM